MSPYLVISSLRDFEVGLGLGGLNLLAAIATLWLPETAGEGDFHYLYEY